MASKFWPPSVTDVASLPATTCAFVTACVEDTKKPLPTDKPAPQPLAVIRAVLASADCGQRTGLGIGRKVDRLGRQWLQPAEQRWQVGRVEQGQELPRDRHRRGQPLGRDADRHRFVRERAQRRGHAHGHDAAEQPDEQDDVRRSHHRPAEGIERPERAVTEAVAELRADRRAQGLAGQHERAQSEDGDQRPHRLLDRGQLVAQDRGEEQRDGEPGHRADESEHRPEEAGPRPRHRGEDEEQDHERGRGGSWAAKPSRPSGSAPSEGHGLGCRVSASHQTSA